jgi:hypothetical protein
MLRVQHVQLASRLTAGKGMDNGLGKPKISNPKPVDKETISPTNAGRSQGSGDVNNVNF